MTTLGNLSFAKDYRNSCSEQNQRPSIVVKMRVSELRRTGFDLISDTTYVTLVILLNIYVPHKC